MHLIFRSKCYTNESQNKKIYITKALKLNDLNRVHNNNKIQLKLFEINWNKWNFKFEFCKWFTLFFANPGRVFCWAIFPLRSGLNSSFFFSSFVCGARNDNMDYLKCASDENHTKQSCQTTSKNAQPNKKIKIHTMWLFKWWIVFILPPCYDSG